MKQEIQEVENSNHPFINDKIEINITRSRIQLANSITQCLL